MYIGTGTVNNANTGFYVDSSGNFSLKDKLIKSIKNNGFIIDHSTTSLDIIKKITTNQLFKSQKNLYFDAPVTGGQLGAINGRLSIMVGGSKSNFPKIKPLIKKGLSRKSLQDAMPPTSARCAIDCALWDLESKITGQRVWELAKIKTEPKPLLSAHSFGISPLSNLARDITKYKINDDIALFENIKSFFSKINFQNL